MKRYIYILTALLAAGAVIFSCSKYDDSAITGSIDELDGRVNNMETTVLAMQANLDALQEIADRLESSASVDSVKQTAEGWMLYFSDGTSVALTDGADGQAGGDGQPGYNPPRIVIVEDGGTYYWAYDDGTPILNGDGERIPASNPAPQLRLSDSGEWEVSFDGGQNWQPAGSSALGGQRAFIAGVTDDELNYYVELQSGYVITLPKTTAGLKFVFLGEDGEEISSLVFASGETKSLSYTMTQSEATLAFTRPDGWKASVSGDFLNITAPDTAVNEYAELGGPISAILTLADGRVFVSTLSVSIEGSGVGE
ncbi:MAG TPA: DUF4988 domain-containing protein [Candidatus Coprenecus pullistercoris]|nr:DUF4988 domain-containing protein [Candidatus Coprenecus pullistercoris]